MKWSDIQSTDRVSIRTVSDKTYVITGYDAETMSFTLTSSAFTGSAYLPTIAGNPPSTRELNIGNHLVAVLRHPDINDEILKTSVIREIRVNGQLV